MTRYANGQKALGICDRCGFSYKLKKLTHIFVLNSKTGLKVCPSCWEPSQPQLRIGEIRVDDPQALREPRPDTGRVGSTVIYVNGVPYYNGIPYNPPPIG